MPRSRLATCQGGHVDGDHAREPIEVGFAGGGIRSRRRDGVERAEIRKKGRAAQRRPLRRFYGICDRMSGPCEHGEALLGIGSGRIRRDRDARLVEVFNMRELVA